MPRALLSLVATLSVALPLAAQSANDLPPGQRPLGAAQMALPTVPSTTLNGVIGQGSGGPCETSGTISDRIFRDGIASSCASPKSWPGSLGGYFYYDTVALMNGTGASQCVTMTLTSSGSMLHLVAYDGTFDPANPAANYLGDTGSSAYGDSRSFSITVAAGQTVVACIFDVDGNSGSSYSLSFDYLAVGCGPAYNLYFEDDRLRSRLWLNSNTGAWAMDMLTGPLAGSYSGTSYVSVNSGLVIMPYPTKPGLALWGYYIPLTRQATFTLRTTNAPANGYLTDTNTTGALPDVRIVK
jgi:hypothetical protein